jgi:hypothetical protein
VLFGSAFSGRLGRDFTRLILANTVSACMWRVPTHYLPSLLPFPLFFVHPLLRHDTAVLKPSEMPSYIADILGRVWRPPINVYLDPADDHKYYKTWGFTLYRTSYSPESEQQWKLLIDKISTTVSAKISRYQGEDPEDVSRLWRLFTLDARSDSAILSGLTRDEICQVYRNAVGGSPMEIMTSLNPDHQIFLLADEEVLQNPNLSVLKVVQADDDPERYYGWMTMDPGSLIDLWVELEEVDCGLSDLIWNELPGAFWEPE